MASSNKDLQLLLGKQLVELHWNFGKQELKKSNQAKAKEQFQSALDICERCGMGRQEIEARFKMAKLEMQA